VLYYGDNLDVLRKYIRDESVDLIYLDPPFNSSRNYNVLFKDESGQESDAQIAVFEDTWHWNVAAERAFQELVTECSESVSALIASLRQFIGANQMMAYLVMMAIRLVELHRALKPSGSLYLHCDPTASHYLKIVLDTIFGPQHFQNEVVWKRTSAHSSAKRYGPVHDVLLFYTKSDDFTWNQQYAPYDAEYLDTFFDSFDEAGRRYKRCDLTGAGTRNGASGLPWRSINITAKGRHWMHPPNILDGLDTAGRIHWPKKQGGMPRLRQYPEDLPGVPLQDVWTDLRPIHNLAEERLDYPTQKPLSLLERVISVSSNPGDLLLDPFCGCGTAIDAAQTLCRQWIGIDVTSLAIALQKVRLRRFPDVTYEVIGVPTSPQGARQLAHDDRYQFQWWALSLIGARPLGGKVSGGPGKKGADQGIDGVIVFLLGLGATPSRVLVQVKSATSIAGWCGTSQVP